MADDAVRDDNGPDLVFERLNSRVLDRIVLVAEFQAPIDGRTDPVLFGVMEVRICLSRPFLKSPDDGIVRLTGSDLSNQQSSSLRLQVDTTRPRRRPGLV